MTFLPNDEFAASLLDAGVGGAVFNVKNPEYGAVGDGAADDTAAIQAAIDAAEVAGGTVLVPSGDYLVTATLIVDAASKVRLVGEKGARLVWGFSSHMLRLRTGPHEVRGLEFFSDGTPTDGRGIIVESTTADVNIEDNVFTTPPSSAIELQTPTRVVIRGNRITNAGKGSAVVSPFIHAIRSVDATDCQVLNNIISDAQGKGIDFGRTAGINDNIKIIGNTIYDLANDASSIGIGLTAGNDCVVSDNYIRNVADNGIDINDLGLTGTSFGYSVTGNTIVQCADGIFFGHDSSVATIAGNTIRACDRGMRILDGAVHVTISGNAIDGTTVGAGILVDGSGGPSPARCSRVTVTNNVIQDASTNGIELNAVDFVVVSGNLIRNPDNHGIAGIDADFVQMQGNFIFGVGQAAANTYDGINWNNVGANFVVEHNHFQGASRNLINMGNSVNGVIAGNTWSTDGTTGNIAGVDSTTSTRFNGLKGSLKTYTPTNVSTDRAYDANATSVDELADVLGTLLQDLGLA